MESNPQELKGIEDAGKKMRVVHYRRCRNPLKENWIIECSIEIFDRVMNRGRIVFNYLETEVKEYLEMPLCYRRCKTGHVVRYCQADVERCYKCSGERECKEKNRACCNCVESGRKDIRHEARDRNCTVYRRRSQHWNEHIEYEGREEG